MGKVTNRLFMQAIEDGTTLSAQMVIGQTLAQGYNKATGVCVPDWGAAALADKPFVYPRVMKGGVVSGIQGGSTWQYNGQALAFGTAQNSDGYYECTSHVSGGKPMFLLGTQTAEGVTVPKLVVNTNLAGAGNLDMDSLVLVGSVEVAGTALGFSVGVEVKLGELSSSGYIGQLTFDGNAVISSREATDEGYSVTVKTALFNGTAVAGYGCRWYLNGGATEITETDAGADIYVEDVGTGAGLKKHAKITVKEPAVTDYATLTCEFVADYTVENGRVRGDAVDTQIIGIDDVQDPEYMWISNWVDQGIDTGSNSNSGDARNGNSATLHRGQVVHWKAWMGTAESTATRDKRYTSYRVKAYNAAKEVIEADGSDGMFTHRVDGSNPASTEMPLFENLISGSGGWYDIGVKEDPTDSSSATVGEFSVAWEDIHQAGGNIEMLVMASD